MGGKAPIEHDPRWPVVSLAEIATKIGSGATPKGGADAYLLSRARFALVRSQNVFDRRFDRDGLAFITDEQVDGLRGVVLQPDDVLLNITGDGITFGRACMVPKDVLPACVNQHVSIIRLDPQRADAGFVLAFLTHPDVKSYIESFNAGGSRRAITKGHIESFRLPLPPLPEQRSIAHILGTLDDKIELNRRISETLEAMAGAIFKSWFVDFDPVRAKAEGRDPGLPKPLADLFPDRFHDSELGDVPAGWKTRSVGDEVELVKGVSYRSEELAPSETALVTLKSVNRGGGYRPDGLKEYTGEYKSEQVLRPNELVVAQTDVTQAAEVIGKPALVIPDDRYRKLVASLDLMIVRPISRDLSQEFFYLMFQTPSFQDHVYGHTNGTTVLHLSKTGVPSFQFCRPSESVVRVFTSIVRELFERLIVNERESRTLTALRNTLLPKLISGELRVSQDVRSKEIAL